MRQTSVVLEKTKTIGELVAIWGAVAIGWLEALQPLLTALATIAALIWSIRQLYLSFKKDGYK